MNAYDREVVHEFVQAIRLETSADRLRECYRPDNLICIDNQARDEINEAKQKRIEELK